MNPSVYFRESRDPMLLAQNLTESLHSRPLPRLQKTLPSSLPAHSRTHTHAPSQPHTLPQPLTLSSRCRVRLLPGITLFPIGTLTIMLNLLRLVTAAIVCISVCGLLAPAEASPLGRELYESSLKTRGLRNLRPRSSPQVCLPSTEIVKNGGKCRLRCAPCFQDRLPLSLTESESPWRDAIMQISATVLLGGSST